MKPNIMSNSFPDRALMLFLIYHFESKPWDPDASQ